MPIMAEAQTMQPQLPSFMSVFEVDSNMTGMSEETDGEIRTRLETAPFANRTVPVMTNGHHFETSHQHHDSTSTSASVSADSSPTTTISTVDSSSITDTSPGSSPESPISILPLSSFSSRRCGISSTEDLSVCSPTSPPPGYNRPLSPGRKARNTKNLSLNMASPTRNAPPPPSLQINTSAFGEHSLPMTAPSSPSFIVPPKPPKRKPSGLTIQPPGTGSLLERGNKGLRIVPPTPASGRPMLLRHHQSSPSLSLFSPTIEVKGGMHLPSFNNQRVAKLFHPPRQAQFSPCPESAISVDPMLEQLSPAKSIRLDQLEEEDIEPPLSQEAKSPAYPNGPVCIYDPYVYLYLEPNDEEASKFDVVLNVAREVKNPFKVAAERREREAKERSTAEVEGHESRDTDITAPETASTIATLQTALENIHSQTPTTLSPTTPKAAEPPREPEYVYMPWDHNTNIVDDLLRLVELIDDRVKQGKRVLVHCQCGVSRSASLIIAYGLYKNPSQTVQEAYDAVKERSRWIGPNMSLIYQLSEFRNLLARKNGMVQPGYRGWRTGGSKGLIANGRANTVSSGSPTSRPSLLLDSFTEPPPEPPQTAPLPADRDRLSPIDTLSPPQLACADKLGDVTPGPSSAPPVLSFIPMGGSVEAHGGSWGPGSEQAEYVIPPLPPNAAFMCHSTGSDLQQGVTVADPILRDTPPTPTLLSPRQAEFMMPFASGRVTEAASSFGFSIGLQNHPPFFADPRSPVQRGEAPIVRSIFDVL
ncbi:hypothetical protein FGG08_002750 [Glutinoglossum americanum]|uniref:protein-tyrosine-phosphatase n=1 Tax=Glutinoglossum americanum TaxID=1670608 RepID=A0A9P8KYV6_9PEZI|nr:hypothetical protein FGG08_002750 [Glutinoglossum americanum]